MQPEFVIANKVKFNREETFQLLGECSSVRVAKGKKIKAYDLASADADDIAKDILGRSGTLRAPALRVGDTFVVGFNAEMYTELFGAA